MSPGSRKNVLQDKYRSAPGNAERRGGYSVLSTIDLTKLE